MNKKLKKKENAFNCAFEWKRKDTIAKRVAKMERSSNFLKLQKLMVSDKKLLFTTISYVTILIIFMNLKFALSPVIGTSASIVYFLINAMFLGHVFFEKQDFFLRFVFGNLLLIVLLALVAWAVMIIYNLDTIMSAFVLCVVTAVCSFLNKMIK
jgi:hypothetical protein